jgi:hypothetical protein
MKKIYYTLILACLFSCEAVFVEDISNDSVVLLAPLDNSQLNVGNNTFSWELINDAETYQIQIAIPNFENANQIVLDSIVLDNNLLQSLDAGTYQWRVKASNSEYETQFSTVNFTVN